MAAEEQNPDVVIRKVFTITVVGTVLFVAAASAVTFIL